LPKRKDPAAVKLGRKGGKEIAKRGLEYFSQLQAKRKKRKGGRPPKSKKSRICLNDRDYRDPYLT